MEKCSTTMCELTSCNLFSDRSAEAEGSSLVPLRSFSWNPKKIVKVQDFQFHLCSSTCKKSELDFNYQARVKGTWKLETARDHRSVRIESTVDSTTTTQSDKLRWCTRLLSPRHWWVAVHTSDQENRGIPNQQFSEWRRIWKKPSWWKGFEDEICSALAGGAHPGAGTQPDVHWWDSFSCTFHIVIGKTFKPKQSSNWTVSNRPPTKVSNYAA